jgi:anti-sigma B factor antagonist
LEYSVENESADRRRGDRPAILRARTRWLSADLVAVQLDGEIDLCNADQIARLADEFDPPASVVLDLSDVSFLGAAGLTALLRLRAQLNSTGRSLFLIGTDHRSVRLPLTICCLDSVFDQPSARSGEIKRLYDLTSSELGSTAGQGVSERG